MPTVADGTCHNDRPVDRMADCPVSMPAASDVSPGAHPVPCKPLHEPASSIGDPDRGPAIAFGG